MSLFDSTEETTSTERFDWIKVREEQLRKFLTAEYFSKKKALENLRGAAHARPVLVLSEPNSLQPIQRVCPRSALLEGSGIRHQAHAHHPSLAPTRGEDPEPACALNKPGRLPELFSADSDKLFDEPFEHSCCEPEDSDLLTQLRTSDWVSDLS